MKLFVNGKVGEAVWRIDTTSMWILSWIKREFEVSQAMKLGEKGWYGFKGEVKGLNTELVWIEDTLFLKCQIEKSLWEQTNILFVAFFLII